MDRRAIPLIVLVAGCFPALAGVAAAPPARLPRTGQEACYGAAGAVIECAGSGQDGDTLTGVRWPDPRFSNNDDRTMTDRLTGLAWSADADPAAGAGTWQEACEYVRTLNRREYLGHADWRLPNVRELESLVNRQPRDVSAWLLSQGFRNVRRGGYWTSSTYAAYAACAWSVDMYNGLAAAQGKVDRGYVWPVREGRPGAVAVPRTGQAACYDRSGAAVDCAGTGQDGESRAGAEWPSPRFADNADGTMTDRLTGLVWSRDGMAPGPAACGPKSRTTGQGARDYVGCLNANAWLGRRDWRLPNVNELASLVNRGEPDSAAWLAAQGFVDVRPEGYWSSTTFAFTAWNAWGVNMRDGAVTSFAGKHRINVWPVRDGP